MSPCGCSVALHSLSCFSLPCFRSLQPTLYCKKLHSFRLHYISPSFLSAFRSPPAALFGSPAGRYGLRLTLFICLHFVLAIKAVASCSALQAVMVFAEKRKAKTSPAFRFHMCRPSASFLSLLVHHPCSTRSGFAGQTIGRNLKYS